VIIVGYIRVSTQRQGRSGLGLEAQRSTIQQYAASIGGRVDALFKDIESGKHSDRPELAKAIARVQGCKGKLVIATLDRLSRDPDFLGALMKAKVDFHACDYSTINRLNIRQRAAWAEEELRLISERTRAALAAAKARGVLLGSARPGHWDDEQRVARRLAGARKATIASAVKRRQAAVDYYVYLLPTIRLLRDEGLSLAKVAQRLNQDGYRTRQGGQFYAATVKVILDRAK
jgi:DNA invertase Pin-like site-specific DNA recombinase